MIVLWMGRVDLAEKGICDQSGDAGRPAVAGPGVWFMGQLRVVSYETGGRKVSYTEMLLGVCGICTWRHTAGGGHLWRQLKAEEEKDVER